MGQYYKAIILAEKSENSNEFICTWLEPLGNSEGSKLTEHAYLTSKTVATVEIQISPEGTHYKSRVVWAGDYADPEPRAGTNLYEAADEMRLTSVGCIHVPTPYRFIVNHTKRQYVDRDKSTVLHPLPLLTAEGNGRGGGTKGGRGGGSAVRSGGKRHRHSE